MLTEATKRNLRRKSGWVDEVQMHRGKPLFSLLELSLTELCNRKCVFCPRVDDAFYPNQNLHMRDSLAANIAAELDELDYEGGVLLCGYGEPLLHPNLDWIVGMFTCRVEIVTNGDHLTAERAEYLHKAGVDHFVVSAYDGPHQIPHFQKVFEQAGILEEHYTIRDRWHSDVDDFGLKLTNRAGTVTTGNQDPVDTAKPCHYPAYQMLIDWNGDALLCPQDWHKKVKFGNVNNESLLEIWQSPSLNRYRRQLMRGSRCQAPCIGCNADGTLHGYNHVSAWKP